MRDVLADLEGLSLENGEAMPQANGDVHHLPEVPDDVKLDEPIDANPSTAEHTGEHCIEGLLTASGLSYTVYTAYCNPDTPGFHLLVPHTCHILLLADASWRLRRLSFPSVNLSSMPAFDSHLVSRSVERQKGSTASFMLQE